MNEGLLSPEALRGWVANRFYYQRNIPRKDAAILSNCPVPTCAGSGSIEFSITMERWKEPDSGRGGKLAGAPKRRRHRSMAATR